MNKFLMVFGLFGLCFGATDSYAVSAGTVSAANAASNSRSVAMYTPSADGARGNQGLANTYKTNQRNTYYMITQPDVDTACREKIFACLTEYCGDLTAVPGLRTSKCEYATESDLYNYTLLCLQKDTSVLLPQYNTNTIHSPGAMNTAARLCPSYVQQELMSFLSMANMATQLSKSNSSLCIQRRQELEAAMACHSVALAYGNETSSKLHSYLTDYCGAGVPGGSVEMVTRFANAGNAGANVWGWAEKIVTLNLNEKGADWRADIDAVLVGYTNRMNLACGDNMQVNTSGAAGAGSNALGAVAALVGGGAFSNTENPYEKQSLFMELESRTELWDYDTAYQVLQSGLTNHALIQNAYFTSAQMDSMQTAYKQGTKVFILRDSARCYIIPVAQLSQAETSLVAQTFANCISK